MSKEDVTHPEVDRRHDAVRRNAGDRRLWVRREVAYRRYGKGRRVWNRRLSTGAVDPEARVDTRRKGATRRVADDRRNGSTRRQDDNRRTAEERRVA